MKKLFSEIESARLRQQADERLGERSRPLGADEIDTHQPAEQRAGRPACRHLNQ